MIPPRAREDDLIIQELPDEVLVYDLKRDKASCLNRAAALVWGHCDGQTTVVEMAALLEDELHITAGEDAVWLALHRLEQARLLQDRVTYPLLSEPHSRRQVLKKMGIVGAVLLVPTVIQIVAPRAAQAATCVATQGCAGLPFGTPCGPPQCKKICCGPPNENCKGVGNC